MNTTSVAAQKEHVHPSIVERALSARRGGPESAQFKDPERMERYHRQRRQDIAAVIDILAQAGIDASRIHSRHMNRIAAAFNAQNTKRGMPLRDQSYAKFDAVNSPYAFWSNLPGILEAKRRYDEFTSEEGRRPTAKEMEEELNLSLFYKIIKNYGRSMDSVHQLFTPPEPFHKTTLFALSSIPNTSIETQQDAPKISEYDPHQYNPRQLTLLHHDDSLIGRLMRDSPYLEVRRRRDAKMREKKRKAELKRYSYKPPTVAPVMAPIPVGKVPQRVAKVESVKYPLAHTYGRTARSPVEFWYHAEGVNQALLRLHWFVNVNPKNPEHKLPNPFEMDMQLGLHGFIAAYKKSHNGDDDILSGFGFRNKFEALKSAVR